jgi:hypothetical protein
MVGSLSWAGDGVFGLTGSPEFPDNPSVSPAHLLARGQKMIANVPGAVKDLLELTRLLPDPMALSLNEVL